VLKSNMLSAWFWFRNRAIEKSSVVSVFFTLLGTTSTRQECEDHFASKGPMAHKSDGAGDSISESKTRLQWAAERRIKTDSSRNISLCIMTRPTGCDDSLSTSLLEARSEAKGRVRRQQGEPYSRFYSFSAPRSIDYPHKCKSVLANNFGTKLSAASIVENLAPVHPAACKYRDCSSTRAYFLSSSSLVNLFPGPISMLSSPRSHAVQSRGTTEFPPNSRLVLRSHSRDPGICSASSIVAPSANLTLSWMNWPSVTIHLLRRFVVDFE
jgi:hypothetical protein